ncbi:MAG: glycosyltransferase [Candidatus Pacebacteria bacterium]|jgi:glycosyltransferase involved in cell wall biosynthesis|nr:glycosyltransferase [Candidatus Paceibacterota bacterium]
MTQLTYVTVKSFPATTADHQYIRSLALALNDIAEVSFQMVVAKSGEDISSIKSFEFPIYLKSRTLSLFWFLLFPPKGFYDNKVNNFLICNDFNIGVVLLIAKRVTFRNWVLVFDTHMLSDSWKDKFVLTRMDYVVTTSPVLRNHVAKLGVAENNIKVVLGGVELEQFEIPPQKTKQIRLQYKIPDKSVVIGYVGSLSTNGLDKGIPFIIQSLQHLPLQYSCLIVGATETEVTMLLEMAEELGVRQRCFVKPKVKADDVPAILSACDILVIPYPDEPHFTKYGFPMKAYEYLAAGKAIIYSKLKIMIDVLVKHEQCVSYRVGDISSFIDAVSEVGKHRVYNDKTLEMYTWKNKAKEIVNFIGVN